MANEIIKITKKLIGFKTVNGNNKEFAKCFNFIKKYFAKEIESGKVITREYKKNSLTSIVFSNIKSFNYDIILNGHIDVVNADEKDFTPQVKNGKLYGRGSADMKSEVAILMKVFKKAVNDGIKKSMALMLTSDEEISGKSGVGYLTNEVVYKSNVVIAPDGGHNFELVIKEKGGFWIKITAKGKLSHGSRPWLGENAIEKLITFYKDLLKSFPPLEKVKSLYQDGVSLNLGKIQGGKNFNSVPDIAEMYLDMRYSEKASKRKITKKIKQLTKKCDITFEIIDEIEILETNLQNPYLIKFKKITEKILNKKIKVSKATGASDARFFSAKNIPVIVMVPNCGNKHGHNEWVEIKSLGKFYRILSNYVETI